MPILKERFPKRSQRSEKSTTCAGYQFFYDRFTKWDLGRNEEIPQFITGRPLSQFQG